MRAGLLLSVRFHDGRYHGTGVWPPAPARLFQALIAGAGALTAQHRAALGWLEALEPPTIAAPVARASRGFTTYVPNNDLDSVGGDPSRVGDIRVPKVIRPWLFDAAVPLIYAWSFEPGAAASAHAREICAIADHLYQLGRGPDMAWAWAEVIDSGQLDARIVTPGTMLFRPSFGERGTPLLCPQPGSLQSLERRFAEHRKQFSEQRVGRKVQTLFARPVKPLLRLVDYNSPSVLLLFDLRRSTTSDSMPEFAPQPVTNIATLVVQLRDGAAERLRKALPGDVQHATAVERVFIGRNAVDADKAARIRITPLPSIGHPQAHQAIRRILVEVPPACPLAASDIMWSFADLDLTDHLTGEILATLFSAEQRSMLRHYGIQPCSPCRVWRTVTPAALPEAAARRRIDPKHLTVSSEQKGAGERCLEEAHAVEAIRHALRHAGIADSPTAVRVQREPFSARGARAEAFAPATRFAKERLWHAEIAFAGPVRGPVVIGDGRYLGLGLMAPVRDRARDVLVFEFSDDCRLTVNDRDALLRAARRALMSRARTLDGGVPRLFSGHEHDGSASAQGQHDHVFLAADGDSDGRLRRLIVAAPWECDHSVRPNQAAAILFRDVVSGLRAIRAGRLGVVTLRGPMEPKESDPIVRPALVWRSHTAFTMTRHARRGSNAADALVKDVLRECERRGLIPLPKVEVGGTTHDQSIAPLVLRFPAAVEGPILLGRDSHRGGGLFLASA